MSPGCCDDHPAPRKQPEFVPINPDEETFTLLPLHVDPKSENVSAPHASRALAAELEALNALSQSLKHHKIATAPPPPVPVNPARSAQVKKFRETGNDHFKNQKYAAAIESYTLGLKMALTRPTWEPSGLLRDEAAMLFANRAQAHMEQRDWVAGAIDAECSVEAKKVGNPKAWYRRGRCLVEMGRVEEAEEWVGKGLEIESEDAELIKLLKEIEAKMPK